MVTKAEAKWTREDVKDSKRLMIYRRLSSGVCQEGIERLDWGGIKNFQS